jgi:hypothetical protein
MKIDMTLAQFEALSAQEQHDLITRQEELEEEKERWAGFPLTDLEMAINDINAEIPKARGLSQDKKAKHGVELNGRLKRIMSDVHLYRETTVAQVARMEMRGREVKDRLIADLLGIDLPPTEPEVQHTGTVTTVRHPWSETEQWSGPLTTCTCHPTTPVDAPETAKSVSSKIANPDSGKSKTGPDTDVSAVVLDLSEYLVRSGSLTAIIARLRRSDFHTIADQIEAQRGKPPEDIPTDPSTTETERKEQQ